MNLNKKLTIKKNYIKKSKKNTIKKQKGEQYKKYVMHHKMETYASQ